MRAGSRKCSRSVGALEKCFCAVVSTTKHPPPQHTHSIVASASSCPALHVLLSGCRKGLESVGCYFCHWCWWWNSMEAFTGPLCCVFGLFISLHFPALSGHVIPASHALIPFCLSAWWMKLMEGSREVKRVNCLKALRPTRAASHSGWGGDGWTLPASPTTFCRSHTCLTDLRLLSRLLPSAFLLLEYLDFLWRRSSVSSLSTEGRSWKFPAHVCVICVSYSSLCFFLVTDLWWWWGANVTGTHTHTPHWGSSTVLKCWPFNSLFTKSQRKNVWNWTRGFIPTLHSCVLVHYF